MQTLPLNNFYFFYGIIYILFEEAMVKNLLKLKQQHTTKVKDTLSIKDSFPTRWLHYRELETSQGEDLTTPCLAKHQATHWLTQTYS